MDPLPPNDPLWKLLGQSRRVEARPNFTQNVLRSARQTGQERGWLGRLRGWWSDTERLPATFAWAAALALALGLALIPAGTEPELARTPVTVEPLLLDADFMEGYEAQWENFGQMGDLLAVQDTALLTDREIHLLLY